MVDQPPAERPYGAGPPRQPPVRRGVIIEPLLNPAQRAASGIVEDEAGRLPVMIELNLRHDGGLDGADRRFRRLYRETIAARERRPVSVSDIYYAARLTLEEIVRLVERDQRGDGPGEWAIYRVWPDFPVARQMDRSVATVKADAAQRSYNAVGRGITWAVIDSGIDAGHPHFATHATLGGETAALHMDFTDLSDPRRVEQPIDPAGHGSHVAGIIAGGLDPAALAAGSLSVRVGERVRASADPDGNEERIEERSLREPALLAGMAPHCRLVSLRVLDEAGQGHCSKVIKALEHVRRVLNGNGKLQRVHGVNLSLGYPFNPRWFACGRSPLCVEVDRLVRSGVVVVAAAGNTGYGELTTNEGRLGAVLDQTIMDPGNAELAITVGSTHRDMPHTYGVSFFSSKGPTGDGRRKPDLVAPGERITSCATGRTLTGTWLARPADATAYYLDDSGTSMAAPHVSGAIAAFLSIRREFIGQPERVKRIFLESATSLEREPYFQGYGLLDLMRAIQSV